MIKTHYNLLDLNQIVNNMKKTITILVLFTINSLFSQNNFILNNELKISNFSLELPKNVLLINFGIIDAPTNYYNELTNETYLEYSAMNNSFFFQGNSLIDFYLRNNHFYFMSPNIRVGNDISSISSLFPTSYNNREEIDNLGFIIIDIKLNNGNYSDVFIVINYNPQTNIISNIHKGEF